jgi:hypothetical protein
MCHKINWQLQVVDIGMQHMQNLMKPHITYSKGRMVPTMVPTMKPPLKPQTDSKNESVPSGRPCESTPCKLMLQLFAHQGKKPGMALHPICNLCTIQQASKQQASICMVGRSRFVWSSMRIDTLQADAATFCPPRKETRNDPPSYM